MDISHRQRDDRGALVEFLRRRDLGDEFPIEFGQIYFVTFDAPFKVRGNHFHTDGYEAFGVVYGNLQVVLEDVRTKERVELELRADSKVFERLTVGPFVAHAFRNVTPTAMLIDYCSKQYDPERPDRNPYVLLE